MTAPLLAVERMTIGRPGALPVVAGMSFRIGAGERLALVGESGSGKTMSALAVIGLLPAGFRVTGGAIRFDGVAVDTASPAMRARRGKDVAIVFQDPMTSLNPVMRIGAQIVEAIEAHDPTIDRAAARRRAIELLDAVRIAKASERVDAYPHEFSGGMRQRVTIAIALANRPRLLIADEPTTALDVTTQTQILALMDELCRAQGTGLLLITHDLGLAQACCDRICVLYGGRVMETGPIARVLARPDHPYTAALLRSVPPGDRDVEWLEPIAGEPPRIQADGPRCRFAGRCAHRFERCLSEEPMPVATGPDAMAACHLLQPSAGRGP
jgi:oligopeptide/dipeptide ABC transporter ATP-binding protein